MLGAFAKRLLKMAAQVSVMAALVLGLVAFTGANKDVVVTVDGEAGPVTTFGGTVADALAAADVEVSPHDEVQPALSAAVHDGSRISVSTAKKVHVELDGAERTVHTTGATVGDLVDELGVSGEAEVSEPTTTVLASSGGYVEISTPRSVHLVVDGKIRSETTTATSVGELLDGLGIRLDDDDRVSASEDAPVLEDMAIKIIRVDKSGEDTVKEDIAFETVTEEDPELPKGEREVITAGKAGTLTKTYKVTRIDGEEVGRKLLSEKVTDEPVAEEIAVGTKEPEPESEPEAKTAASGDAGDTDTSGPAPSGVWQSLANCESGGDWSINTGNGYYGGLQFSKGSWLGAGGGQYASLPHQASPSEQIATAKVLKQSGGWGHWPSCAAQLGLL